MSGVARIDDDGVQLGPVGSSILHSSHPFPVLRVVVDKGKRLPRDAAILGAEQPLRRSARIPDAWLTGMTWRQPERVIDRTPSLAFHRLAKCRRMRGLLPRAPKIGGTKDSWAEVAGLRCREQ